MATFIAENFIIMNESMKNTEVVSQDTAKVHELSAEFELYRRIDEELLQGNSAFAETNAVHGAMCKMGHIPRYEVYEKIGAQEIAVVVHVGDRLCGHPGIVHGGIISTIFDNSFGWLNIATKQKPAFTANLNISFRKPVFANSTAIVRARITSIEGRKVFMSATWENTEGEIFAESTTLFITPKPEVAAPA
jgi:acyl-coenzyme A thioesterase PaaI-like protein